MPSSNPDQLMVIPVYSDLCALPGSCPHLDVLLLPNPYPIILSKYPDSELCSLLPMQLCSSALSASTTGIVSRHKKQTKTKKNNNRKCRYHTLVPGCRYMLVIVSRHPDRLQERIAYWLMHSSKFAYTALRATLDSGKLLYNPIPDLPTVLFLHICCTSTHVPRTVSQS